jgi:hypothetical protein
VRQLGCEHAADRDRLRCPPRFNAERIPDIASDCPNFVGMPVLVALIGGMIGDNHGARRPDSRCHAAGELEAGGPANDAAR